MLKKPKKAKRQIGYMPEGVPLYNDLTPKEFVTYMAGIKKVDRKTVKEKVNKIIEETGLTNVQNKLIRNLSRGYKQRVSMAGALVGEPKILILDEPTAGFDPMGRDEILNMLKETHERTGNTVILVSHSMEDVANYADRIVVIDKGQIKYNDTPKKVFQHYKDLEAMGLAAPQVTYFMNDLKKAGMPVSTDATTVQEARDEILKLMGRK
jgi:ABC-type multidrug transport system ATPase subunit